MPEDPKLSKNDIAALADIARWAAAYRYKPSAMARLAAHGYVARIGGNDRFPEWKITDAGTARHIKEKSRA